MATAEIAAIEKLAATPNRTVSSAMASQNTTNATMPASMPCSSRDNAATP